MNKKRKKEKKGKATNDKLTFAFFTTHFGSCTSQGNLNEQKCPTLFFLSSFSNNACNILNFEFTNILQIPFIHLYKQVNSNPFHKRRKKTQKDRIIFSRK